MKKKHSFHYGVCEANSQTKRRSLLAGIAALLITAMFTIGFVACDNGTTPTGNGNGNGNGNGDGNGNGNGDGNGNGETTPLITGKFASQTGTGDAVFYADYLPAARSVSRAAGDISAAEKELTGKIEDGDIVFNLKGVYDTSTNQFFLSAGSSFLIYQIAGTLTDGGLDSTTAAVKVKTDDEWTLHTVAVTATSEAEIDADASAEQEEGIPSRFFGTWNLVFDKTGEGYDDQTIVVTAFQWVDLKAPDAPAGLMDITGNDVSGYTMIFQAVSVYESQDPWDGKGERPPVVSTYTTEYIKITAQVSGEQLKVKYYWDSVSEDYATAKAFDTANPTGNIDTSTMTRIN
jgi:hypothetical protein